MDKRKILSSFFDSEANDTLDKPTIYGEFIEDILKTYKDCLMRSDYDFYEKKRKEMVNVKHENGRYEISVDTSGYLPEDITVTVNREDRTVTVKCTVENKEESENGYSYNKSFFETTQRVPDEIDIYSLRKEYKDCGDLSIVGNDLEEENHIENIVEL